MTAGQRLEIWPLSESLTNPAASAEQQEAVAESFQFPEASLSPRHYRNLLRFLILSTAAIALIPLIVLTALNCRWYEQSFAEEVHGPIVRLTSNGKHSLEYFLQERKAALRLIANTGRLDGGCDETSLDAILKDLRSSISVGVFVDLGVFDANGDLKCYAGPPQMTGKNYQDQDWFDRASREGIAVSDVFLGYRNAPHFVVAIRHSSADGRVLFLRGSIDTARIQEQLLRVGLTPTSDTFVVNRQGILQSQSRRHGRILEDLALPMPPVTDKPAVIEMANAAGEAITVGLAQVTGSPFVLMLVTPTADVMGGWVRMRAYLLGLLALAIGLVLTVILILARNLIRSIRESDLARAQVFHKIEYTSKLASVGRLAAGVAHEINNPLAIINETAGLFKDRLPVSEDFPAREKALADVDSILRAVDRCSTITHRLLGFARHMDLGHEQIDLVRLIEEVLGFLEKEAAYRGIEVVWKVEQDLPRIRSDRGQLQQVFLNIINNAFAALEDGGRIGIVMRALGTDRVAVAIEDVGVGIPEEALGRVFEPFFTTKPGVGTGLGLSVTYGLVKKLGGVIRVESEPGEGTSFTVILPIDTGQ